MRILKIQEKQFNLISTEGTVNDYTIIFQKNGYSLLNIQNLLNECYEFLSPIIIQDEGDLNFTSSNMEMDTSIWKLKSIEEKDDCFELILLYKVDPTPEQKLEILSAKLDYLAIMSDIELQEV